MANADEPKTSDNGTVEEGTQTENSDNIPPSKETQERIIRQIEYYFGDINLPRDKFLQEQVALDDGWVPFSVLLTFNRLASICSSAVVVANVIAKSDSQLLEVSEDKKKIRRNPGLPAPEYNDERRKELMSRTAYAKEFPNDESLESIMKFMQPHGEFESVIMRTYKDKALGKHMFKGSIFIIFKDVDTCKKFIEEDEVKFNGTNLIRKWQADYLEGKREERQTRRMKKDGLSGVDVDKKQSRTFPKGAVVHMAGFKGDSITRENIKEQLVEIFDSEPAYITFNKGDSEGYVRYNSEGDAVKFMEKLTDSKFKIGEDEITARALEGEEEEKFLEKLSVTIAEIRHHSKHGKGKNRKRKSAGGDSGPKVKHTRK